MVSKGESASYLGPAVLHLINVYYGWGLWSARRQVLVTALFFEVFTETIHQIREAEDFRCTTDKEMISKMLTLPLSV